MPKEGQHVTYNVHPSFQNHSVELNNSKVMNPLQQHPFSVSARPAHWGLVGSGGQGCERSVGLSGLAVPACCRIGDDKNW